MFLLLTLYLVDIFLANQEGVLADALIEGFATRHVEHLAQAVQDSRRLFDIVLRQPVLQFLLTLLLYLTIGTAQHGLNLGLGLGRGHEVHP